jgi:hypothetical protein
VSRCYSLFGDGHSLHESVDSLHSGVLTPTKRPPQATMGVSFVCVKLYHLL